jgi:hypothetical protein
MDDEPFIIAAMMEEEEKLPFPHDTYRQFQNKQTAGGSIIKWIVIGVIIIIIFLLIRS